MILTLSDDDDLWTPGSGGRTISFVTRRDVFDYIRTSGFSWFGQMDELPFLGRLYDLDSLPSTDNRFRTATGDIRQHRINNDDWEDDWIFTDPRLKLASGPDDALLEFLVQMVHPVVRPDAAESAEIVRALNDLLRPDGGGSHRRGTFREGPSTHRCAWGRAVAQSCASLTKLLRESIRLTSRVRSPGWRKPSSQTRSWPSALRRTSSRPSVRPSLTGSTRVTRRMTTSGSGQEDDQGSARQSG